MNIKTTKQKLPKWFKGTMVREGKFVGKESGSALWSSNSIDVAKRYSMRAERMAPHMKKYVLGKDVSKPTILEFEVPKSYIKKHSSSGLQEGGRTFIFKEGLPKEFLKKVHCRISFGSIYDTLYKNQFNNESAKIEREERKEEKKAKKEREKLIEQYGEEKYDFYCGDVL